METRQIHNATVVAVGVTVVVKGTQLWVSVFEFAREYTPILNVYM